jgi:fatty-acyl-CoA synthase
MLGLMQDRPLLIWQLLEHGARHHGQVEIVSRRVEGDVHRYTYRDALHRAYRVANAIDALGIAPGERIATLAWNGYRHFELYYGVSGSERILHTLNPRLTAEQLAWIVADADDRVLCFDLKFFAARAGGACALPERSSLDRTLRGRCVAEDNRHPQSTKL